MPKIRVGELEYNTEDLSDNGKALLASLQFLEVQMQKLNNEQAQIAMIKFVDARISELTNIQALLTRVKKSYLDVLEREIIKARTGVDFSTLLSD